MTTYLENDNPNAHMPNAVLVLTDGGSRLLLADKHAMQSSASFDLGPYRLFRPDHDSQFTSESGRVWRPVE